MTVSWATMQYSAGSVSTTLNSTLLQWSKRVSMGPVAAAWGSDGPGGSLGEERVSLANGTVRLEEVRLEEDVEDVASQAWVKGAR